VILLLVMNSKAQWQGMVCKQELRDHVQDVQFKKHRYEYSVCPALCWCLLMV